MLSKILLTSALTALAHADQECPDGFEAYNEDGMCVLQGFMFSEYICPGYIHGESHSEHTANGSYILCPGKGCGNEEENWCCPSSDSLLWTCKDQRSDLLDNSCASNSGCECSDDSIYITGARIVGEIQEIDNMTNSKGVCCPPGAQNCEAILSLDHSESTKVHWQEQSIGQGLFVGQNLQIYNNQRINLDQNGFQTELRGGLVNGQERDGTRMEGEARCSRSRHDQLSFISLSQEITSISVPIELDYTTCGVTGTIQATVEQVQKKQGQDCQQTICGQNRGCNAISGCTEQTLTTRQQLTEELSLMSVTQDSQNTSSTFEINGSTWYWVAAAICASAMGGIYLGKMKGQNKNIMTENSYQQI